MPQETPHFDAKMTRLAHLAAALVLVGLLAGCASDYQSASSPAGELHVQFDNQQNRAYDLQIVVRNATGATVVERTTTIDSGTSRRSRYPIGTEGAYAVTVRGRDRFETTVQWNTEECETLQIQVEMTPDGVNATSRCAEN
jgi:hypothetical protein